MSNLKILHWNSNGILNKIHELQALASRLKIDIILINETHLKSSNKIKLTNFHIYRTDLPSIRGSRPHGGTAVFVHRRITHQRISLNTNLQSTSIKIKLNNSEILVSAVYKPPNEILDPADLDTLTTSADWSIAAGDFNAKNPLWNSRTVNNAGKILYSHVQNGNYAVLAPTTPTYHPYARRYQPDVLDIALVNLPMSVQVFNLNELSSDHNPVLLEVHSTPIGSSPPTSNTLINWQKFPDTLNSSTSNVNPPVSSTSDIDLAINNLTSSIHSAIENSTFTVNKNKLKNSLPPEIVAEIQMKNKLRREWQLNRDPAIKTKLNAKISFIRSILQVYKQD